MIKFQQTQPNIQQPRPWPVVIGDDGTIIHGRPDANYLVGFGPQGTYEITVFWKDALEHPEKAVGLCPTFTSVGGDMFGVDLLVESCSKYEASDESVETLRESEMRMRAALDM